MEENDKHYKSLTDDSVHIWYAFQDSIRDPESLDNYFNILSQYEQERQQKFVFEKDRHTYLISHALLRICLSQYADFSPDKWSFKENRYGKPEIDLSVGTTPLQFNLSHTDGLVIVAIALDSNIGIDVENVNRRGEMLDIAERYFSPDEVKSLFSLPVEQQRRRFFDCWTLKEAYIKARGMGLSIPLEQFSFQLEQDNAVRIIFNEKIEDDPNEWQFSQFELESIYKVAVAIERGKQVDLDIDIREFTL